VPQLSANPVTYDRAANGPRHNKSDSCTGRDRVGCYGCYGCDRYRHEMDDERRPTGATALPHRRMEVGAVSESRRGR